ncbi:MAG TPA: prolyl oligopeptidase family serine peptidase [Nannocystis sp.]|jgi:dipeptidyl aminopeptidase/acylaminoacyl peptidase
MRSLLGSLAALSLLLACAPPNKARPYPTTPPVAGDASAAPSTGLVRYFDRAVDLGPFLTGFPFERWMPSLETDRLFFFATGERYTLKMLDLRGATVPYDLGKATSVGDVDWSKRSLWSLHHHAASDTLWLHADERNDEQMNLWTLDLKSGLLTQVTRHDYVYGLGFSEDDKQVAYLPRTGTKAPFSTCLRVMDVQTKAAREVVCDTPALRFTWSEIRWSPDASEVYFQAQVEGDRNRVQLVSVDLTAARPTVRVLTDAKTERTDAVALEGFVDDDRLIFIANDDGFANLHAYSRKTRQVKQLTRFTEDVTSARLVDAGVFAVHRTPMGSSLSLVDPRSGKVLGEQPQRGKADILDGHGERVLWTQEAPDLVFELSLATLAPSDGKAAGLGNVRVIGLPEALSAQIVQCRAEAVKIPTFDRVNGKPRELHAFVLHPLRPLADKTRKVALVRSFYGGENSYSTFDHVMCAAGLTVVSPAVRGSDGFGKTFSALNDRDLGGDEIVDLFHVARWIEKTLGLTPRQIGVYGGSHGGYATMRALTFPPATNNRNDSYAFGFGLSHAGFSDIKNFHDQSNIPDWVVLESGDPSKPDDLARMRDRSPISHVDLLRAPLLLTHGGNDWRVPVGESRAFHEKAKALGKPTTYVEFAGQGHHIEGLTLLRQLFQARFDFLMAVAQGATPAPASKPMTTPMTTPTTAAAATAKPATPTATTPPRP